MGELRQPLQRAVELIAASDETSHRCCALLRFAASTALPRERFSVRIRCRFQAKAQAGSDPARLSFLPLRSSPASGDGTLGALRRVVPS